MISTILKLVTCCSLLTCSHSTPVDKITAVGPGRQLEFINGEIVCSGHVLEENFRDNLAAAASKMDEVCLSDLGLYSDYHNPAAGTEGNTMVYACTYGAVASCNSARFSELNPRFDEVCPGQGAWMYNQTIAASYGRDPAGTVECY